MSEHYSCFYLFERQKSESDFFVLFSHPPRDRLFTVEFIILQKVARVRKSESFCSSRYSDSLLQRSQTNRRCCEIQGRQKNPSGNKKKYRRRRNKQPETEKGEAVSDWTSPSAFECELVLFLVFIPTVIWISVRPQRFHDVWLHKHERGFSELQG